MRKLILLLLFPAFLFAQDFRKMSFGQSIEELKETYPATEFVEENEMEMVILSHDDMIGGIETSVAYLFVDNLLMSGFYYFDRTSFKSSDDRYKDYKNISEFLNGKYEMEETNTWHNDSYKDSPNSYDHALGMGYVDFSESYTTDKLVIKHSVSRSEGIYTHILGYMSPSFRESMVAENESDF
tara:strand:+ start:1321 stop:1869 length:549 start_codon:yes stop_codon:yes gene_type:complete